MSRWTLIYSTADVEFMLIHILYNSDDAVEGIPPRPPTWHYERGSKVLFLPDFFPTAVTIVPTLGPESFARIKRITLTASVNLSSAGWFVLLAEIRVVITTEKKAFC